MQILDFLNSLLFRKYYVCNKIRLKNLLFIFECAYKKHIQNLELNGKTNQVMGS